MKLANLISLFLILDPQEKTGVLNSDSSETEVASKYLYSKQTKKPFSSMFT